MLESLLCIYLWGSLAQSSLNGHALCTLHGINGSWSHRPSATRELSIHHKASKTYDCIDTAHVDPELPEDGSEDQGYLRTES